MNDNTIQLTQCVVTITHLGTEPNPLRDSLLDVIKAGRLRSEAAELIQQAAKLIDQSIEFDDYKMNPWNSLARRAPLSSLRGS